MSWDSDTGTDHCRLMIVVCAERRNASADCEAEGESPPLDL